MRQNTAWAVQGNYNNNFMFYASSGWDAGEALISQYDKFGNGVSYTSMTSFQDQYRYDNLKRLSGVIDPNYARNYSFDPFGNMSISSAASVRDAALGAHWCSN